MTGSTDLAAAIAAARTATGLTPADLASRVGVDEAELRRWEAGDPPTDVFHIISLSEVLDVDFLALSTGADDTPTPPQRPRTAPPPAMQRIIVKLDALTPDQLAEVERYIESRFG